MSFLGRLMGRKAAPAKPADPGGPGGPVANGTTERNVGGKHAATPEPPPVLPLDDDGNDARNIGG